MDKHFETIPLPHKIHKLSHYIELHAHQILHDEFDLQFTSYVFLYMLAMKHDASQSELSNFCGITPAGASKQIQKLVAEKLITVETNPENRRENLLNLTKKGKDLQRASTKALDGHFKSVTKDLDLKAFDKMLNRLIELYMTSE